MQNENLDQTMSNMELREDELFLSSITLPADPDHSFSLIAESAQILLIC